MDTLLKKAVIASIEAGKKIAEIYQQADFEIEIKSDNTPITQADRTAHEIIAARLAGDFPVLSEEGEVIPYETRKNWKTFWLVDPLDGTKEFIQRNDEFTVNIALINEGVPVLGVIYAPVSCELYYADKIGSFKCLINPEEEINIEKIIDQSMQLPYGIPGENLVVVSSRSHHSPETEAYIRQIDTQGKPLKVIPKGSSLKFCMVASGEANLYPKLGPTMEWDIAAGHAIARYAGKTVAQIQTGKPLEYNKENLLNPWFVVQ
ncbi:MAG TPA: 3'(2'),5'-bisphosphate nucleotidase CysQ [Prolixibacteraceae bacterium]|nr:3'(2'),5'-bisphosphate nucleotidase CysQ [Prolixibacteraceae bacterium]HPS11804.1 3'(2'),5'-bisphosphate nucleotidase CysQ [Prolixibacteraceae bacterium]